MEILLKLQIISIAFIAMHFVCKNQAFAAKNSTTNIPAFTLITCKKIPIPPIGFGTWQSRDVALEKALDAALEVGYRHIDTAYLYENEKAVGNVLKRWISQGKIKRDEIYLVTKLPPFANHPDCVSEYLNKSLENLQVDYVDLYHIHTPFPINMDDDNNTSSLDTSIDHLALWKEMEKQVDAGLTKAIGLSNFNQSQIERILKNCKIQPSTLQIEHHLYLQQNELVEFCKKNNIIISAYSPFGMPGIGASHMELGVKAPLPNAIRNPRVTEIAEKHSKSESHVLLRFDIQRGIIPLPTTTNPKRMKRHLEIFDFELDDEDIQKLKSLDANIRGFNFTSLKGVVQHPEYPFAN